MREEDINFLKTAINSSFNPECKDILEKQYLFGIKLLEYTKSDIRFNHSIIFHMNCTIEGIIKIFLKCMGYPHKGTLGTKISKLKGKNLFSDEIVKRLDLYRERI